MRLGSAPGAVVSCASHPLILSPRAWATGKLTFGPRCSLQGGREGGSVVWEVSPGPGETAALHIEEIRDLSSVRCSRQANLHLSGFGCVT